jgi:hypothetical protein
MARLVEYPDIRARTWATESAQGLNLFSVSLKFAFKFARVPEDTDAKSVGMTM